MIEQLKHWDTQLFLFLNGLHNDSWDFIMYYSSEKLTWIPLYLFILYLTIKYFKWNSLVILLATGILITLCDQLSVHGFKEVFMRLRPCHEPSLDGLVHTVYDKCGGQFGFVSSHAINHFGLAVFLTVIFSLKVRYFSIFILFWAFWVSYSRIYLGVHYPGDIISGGLIGAILGWLFGKVALFIISKLTSRS